MVVRSAQKGRDDIQKIRDAMESRKPVITDYQRELIVKQANIIGEDGEAMIQDIENEALETNQMAAGNNAPRQLAQRRQAQRGERREDNEEVSE